jgi:hypothetical protein
MEKGNIPPVKLVETDFDKLTLRTSFFVRPFDKQYAIS